MFDVEAGGDVPGTVCGAVELEDAEWAMVNDEELGGLPAALGAIDVIINVERRSVPTHRKSCARQYPAHCAWR